MDLSAYVLIAKANLDKTINIQSINDGFNNNETYTSVNDITNLVNNNKN